MGKKLKKPASFDYDLICIGSGSAGGSAAVLAAQAGLKVALIEGGHLGGDSARFSCIPVNACLQTVKSLEAVNRAPLFGLSPGRLKINWRQIMNYKDECVRQTGVLQSEETFRKAGIDVLKGFAKFIDPWTISLNRRPLKALNILIASGSKDVVPEIKGLNSAQYLTYKEVLNLPSLPTSVFIIGGGMTGCALAEILNACGSRVYLAEKRDRLLNDEDSEIGQVEAEILKNKGVNLLLNCQISQVKNKEGQQKEVVIAVEGATKNILIDQVIVACGRQPQTDLGLPDAGIAFNKDSGIAVNKYLETNLPHIYAVGDAVGHIISSRIAHYHSRLALHNMMQTKNKTKMPLNYQTFVRHLALSPEIAACGPTEQELLSRQTPYKKTISPLHQTTRSQLSRQRAGFVKILTTPRGIVLGGSIIAPNAGDMIYQLSLALQARLSVTDLKNNLKAFPTWSEALSAACQ